MERYDALVIGGGPGGAAAAVLLARAGWSVAVVERAAFPRRKVCGEFVSASSLPLLDHLGVGAAFRRLAGPPVRRAAVYAGAAAVAADLPAIPGPDCWGRALGREHLDALLLAEAAAAGAIVHQPFSAGGLIPELDGYRCEATAHGPGGDRELHAPIVVAAHGSWGLGPLPTLPARKPCPSDLFAFKAHYRGHHLAGDVMPYVAFPGGYGGMVVSDGGRVSTSFCIRRDRLAVVREPGEEAGAAVLRYAAGSCRGVAEALAGSVRDGPWLAAGPLRPGIRRRSQGGVFRVGNAAGEAHPAAAEGISMAVQGAWLLAGRLIAWRRQPRRAELAAVGADYARTWRRAFGPRLLAAATFAHWAMRPAAVAGVMPVLRALPALVTGLARLTGKTTRVVRV
jgi:flavin-dependent dehydrogenase